MKISLSPARGNASKNAIWISYINFYFYDSKNVFCFFFRWETILSASHVLSIIKLEIYTKLETVLFLKERIFQ